MIIDLILFCIYISASFNHTMREALIYTEFIRSTSIPQYVIIYVHIKFIDFMVIEVCFFKKRNKKMKNMDMVCRVIYRTTRLS